MSIKYGTKDITDIPGITKVYHGEDFIFSKNRIKWKLFYEDDWTSIYKVIVPINRIIQVEINSGFLDVEDSKGSVKNTKISDNPIIYRFESRESEVTLITLKGSKIVSIKAGGASKPLDFNIYIYSLGVAV